MNVHKAALAVLIVVGCSSGGSKSGPPTSPSSTDKVVLTTVGIEQTRDGSQLLVSTTITNDTGADIDEPMMSELQRWNGEAWEVAGYVSNVTTLTALCPILNECDSEPAIRYVLAGETAHYVRYVSSLPKGFYRLRVGYSMIEEVSEVFEFRLD